MRAGQLRHSIVIQQVTETNTGGVITNVWSEYDTVRAEVLPISGSEFWAAAQVQDEDVVMFKIRYLSGVLQKMRILYDYRAYDIKGVMPVRGRRKEMLVRTTIAPQEYATFDYGTISVAVGATDGDVDVMWSTGFYSSSNIRIREHEAAPMDFVDRTEADTDPRVLSHSFGITGVKASTLYELQVWGENEVGWSPGWSSSYYFSSAADFSVSVQGDDPLI